MQQKKKLFETDTIILHWCRNVIIPTIRLQKQDVNGKTCQNHVFINETGNSSR